MKFECIEAVFLRLSDSGLAAQFEDDDGDRFWLPVSQIEFDWRATEGERVDVQMPLWMARERGFV